jgi:TonB family protein
MLTWDSKSSDIASAKAGLVTIKDGPNQRELLLTQQQLAGGRLFYLPASEIVQFTFQVFTEAGVLRDHAAATMPPRASIFSGATQQLQPAAPRPIASPPPVQSSNSASIRKDGITPEARTLSGRSPTIPIRTSPTVGAGAPAPMQPERSNSSAGAGGSSMDQPVVAAHQSLPGLTPSAVEQLVPTTSIQAPSSSAQPTAPSPPADQAAGNAASTPAQNPVQDVVPRTYIPPRAILQTKPSVPGGLQALITREIVVEVNLTIGADGSILRAEAVPGEGSIHKSLSELALATAKLWKFRPAREGTQNVSGEVQIQFQFGPDR